MAVRNLLNSNLIHQAFWMAAIWSILCIVTYSVSLGQDGPATSPASKSDTSSDKTSTSSPAKSTTDSDKESAPVTLPERWTEKVEEYLASGRIDEASKLVDEAVKSAPNQAVVYLIRGMVRFRLGNIEGSLVDFDKSIELNPSSKPYCWQRGISLYYLGKYAEGRDQFIVHREVNSNDVENSFWHFMCVAKLDGIDAARKQLLPSEFDSRPPLMDILEMLKGNQTSDQVIATTDAVRGGPKGKANAKFYGYLYIALYYDCIGKNDLAKDFLQKCLDQKTGGYMADVARIHLEQLGKATPK